MIVAAVFKSLFENVIFLSAFTSLCASQLTKMFIAIVTSKNKKIWETILAAIWSTGGMPSSHSAVVCSLTVSVGLTEGASSNLFVFCIVFTMVVLRDALGVRRAAGLQAKALNTFGKLTAEKIGVEFQAVKEIQGHTPLEVAVGVILGISIAAGFCL